MKFRTFTVFLLGIMILAFSLNVVSVNADAKVVEAVYGTTVLLDGVVDFSMEWNDASLTWFSLLDGPCFVYVKQDGEHLHIGMIVSDVTLNIQDSVQVTFCKDHDHASVPSSDDILLRIFRPGIVPIWWEYHGDGVDWNSVIPEGWDWNAGVGDTVTYWEVELQIEYSKLGVTAGAAKTLGINFFVINDVGGVLDLRSWTEVYALNDPSTWGNIMSTENLWVPWFTSLPMVLLLSVTLFVVLRKRPHQLLNAF